MSADALTRLLARMERNAAHLGDSYASANQLLDAAVGEAVPWVLGLPGVRGRIPGPLRSVLPRGASVSLDKIERLATMLVAILAASYGSEPPGGTAPAPEAGAKVHHLKEQA